MSPTSKHRIARDAAAVAALALILSAPVAVAQGTSADPGATPVRISPDARLTPGQRERLQRVADQGIDALRRHLWITRGFSLRSWRLSDLLDSAA
jgi:hypothetical protein